MNDFIAALLGSAGPPVQAAEPVPPPPAPPPAARPASRASARPAQKPGPAPAARPAPLLAGRLLRGREGLLAAVIGSEILAPPVALRGDNLRGGGGV